MRVRSRACARARVCGVCVSGCVAAWERARCVCVCGRGGRGARRAGLAELHVARHRVGDHVRHVLAPVPALVWQHGLHNRCRLVPWQVPLSYATLGYREPCVVQFSRTLWKQLAAICKILGGQAGRRAGCCWARGAERAPELVKRGPPSFVSAATWGGTRRGALPHPLLVRMQRNACAAASSLYTRSSRFG